MPPVAVSEFEQVITELGTVAGTAVDRLLARLDRLLPAEARAFITDAYPALLDPFLKAAGELAAQWYAEQPVGDLNPGAAAFAPVVAPLPPARDLGADARWALTRSLPAVDLGGTAVRRIRNASRDTVVINTEREGVVWVREAKPNACGFCRLLSIRATVGLGYSDRVVADKLDNDGNPTGEKTIVVRSGRKRRRRNSGPGRRPGEEYHTNCRCIAVPVRDGNYTPPDYIQQWADEYSAIVYGDAVTPDGIGAKDPALIARYMDRGRVRADRDPATTELPMPQPRTPRASDDSTPVELDKPPAQSKADIAKRLLPELEKSLAALRADGLAEDSPQITWHREQIARLSADLVGVN